MMTIVRKQQKLIELMKRRQTHLEVAQGISISEQQFMSIVDQL